MLRLYWSELGESEGKTCQAYSLKSFKTSCLWVCTLLLCLHGHPWREVWTAPWLMKSKWGVICWNDQGSGWQVELIYFWNWRTTLEKMNQAWWVKASFHPSLLNLVEGVPAKTSSLPFPALLPSPLMEMVSYTPSLYFILRWSQLQQQCSEIVMMCTSLPRNAQNGLGY